MTGDRDRGLGALKLWYNSSAVSMGMSFDDVVAYYDDKSPTFLANFGAAVRNADLSQDRLQSALQNLAYDGNDRMPIKDSFFQALSGEVTTFRYDDAVKVAKQTVADTVSTVKTAVVAGASLYALWIVGGIVLLMVLNKAERRAA